jgi:hypothetical protein
MGNLAIAENILKKTVKDHLLDEMSIFKNKMGFKNDWQLITYLEKKSDVPKSSIHRVLTDKKTIPTPQTFYNLYSSLYETNKYEEVISKVPKDVAEYFTKYLLKSSCSEVHDISVEEYILKDQLALRIYNECAGTGSTLEKIQLKFGEFGINEMHKLKNMNVLKIENGSIRMGKVRISSTPSNIQRRLLFNLEKYYRPFQATRKDENFLFSRIENTSPATYKEIVNDIQELWNKVSERLEREAKTKNDSELTVKFCFGGLLDKVSEE